MGLVSALLALLFAVGWQQPNAAPDLSRYFVGLDGTFVLLNGRTNEYVRYNTVRAGQRFAPCSTFKIPHTAILLESGTAPRPRTVLIEPRLVVRASTMRPKV